MSPRTVFWVVVGFVGGFGLVSWGAIAFLKWLDDNRPANKGPGIW